MDVSIFSIFFCSRRGKGESEAPRGGGSIFVEIPMRGGFSRGAGKVSAANWEMGGGLNIFFGAEMSTKPECVFTS